jgi:Carboxypeptidase regulatory-like domain
MKRILTLLITALSLQSPAQQISGNILDEKKEPIVGAVVLVFQAGILKGSTATDWDGNYIVKPLDAGSYDLVATFAGHDSVIVTGIIVENSGQTSRNITLAKADGTPKCKKIKYVKPLINPDTDWGRHPGGCIDILPSTDVIDVITSALPPPCKTPHQELNIDGSRTTGTEYIVDAPPGIHQKQIRTYGEIDYLPNSRTSGTQYIVDGPCWVYSCPLPETPKVKLNIFTKEDIDHMPVTCVQDVLSLLPGVYQARRGDDISIFGSRMDGNHYFIDGMQ